MNCFAFIGTRELSTPQLNWIEVTIEWLASQHPDAILHTGAAPGTDQHAAELWAVRGGNVMLHLPWGSYEEDWVRRMELDGRVMGIVPAPKQDYVMLASMHHGNWDSLSQGVQKLHMRNVGIIKPCEDNGEVYATPGMSPWGGGTAMGIKIARHLGISKVEVFDPLNRDWSRCGC